ncbi:MAG: hypothetical protein WC956_00040 [bacterium]
MRAAEMCVLSSLVLAACGGEEFTAGANSSDAGIDTSSDIVVAPDSPSDVQPDDAMNPDALLDADVFTKPDAGDAEAGPNKPKPPKANFYSDAPCPFPASLSYEQVSNTLLMACGAYAGQPNALHRSQPLNQNGAWTKVGNAKGYPSNHIALNDQYYLVTHSAPNGFTIINGKNNTSTASVDFAAISPLDPLYAQIKSTINNPAGAVLVGGQLCVATSNLDQIDPNDPSKTTFKPGSVICTPYNFDGTVSVAMTYALMTSGVNPTGMALIDKDPVSVDGGTIQRFAALSSNSYANNPADDAKLDIFEINSGSSNSISLGKRTTQTAPVLARTEDGASFLIGVQKPSAGFLGIRWEDGASSYPSTQLKANNYIYGMGIFGKLALATDAGMYDNPAKSGQLIIQNMDPSGWKGELATPLPGMAGPSIVINGKHFAAVTVSVQGDAGPESKGQVLVTDLAGLQ